MGDGCGDRCARQVERRPGAAHVGRGAARWGVPERYLQEQAAQAEAFEELTNANDATRKRLNALSEQVIALSDQIGQQPQMRVSKAAPEAASPRPKDGPPAERRSMLVSPASSGGS